MTVVRDVLLSASLGAMIALLIPSDGNAQTRRSTPAPAQTDQGLVEGERLETLSQCMSYWDPTTQMSKSEWRDTCRRTQNGANPLGTSEQPIRDTTKRRRDR